MAGKIKTTEFVGIGCLLQALGLLCPFVGLLAGLPGFLFGLLPGLDATLEYSRQDIAAVVPFTVDEALLNLHYAF